MKSGLGNRARTALLAHALALVACLCGPSPAGAVVGGAVDANAITPFGGVASLTTTAGACFSAVLISPRHALTAAHVVSGTRPSSWTLNLNAGGNLTSRHAVESITVAPGYAGFAPDPADGLVHNDLAVLRLATPVPVGVPYYKIAPMLPGDALTLVGYGASGPIGGPIAPAAPSVKHAGSNAADLYLSRRAVGVAPLFDVYAFDVDAGTSDATLGGGDSGSAAFVKVNGAWRLAGINTFVGRSAIPGASATTAVGGGMVLSAFEQWIARVTSEP